MTNTNVFRRQLASVALLSLAIAGCKWEDVEEEIDQLFDDHDLVVTADREILVGGSGEVWVEDGCTPTDNEECQLDQLTITKVTPSGALIGSGTSIVGNATFAAGPSPGAGTVTVEATNQDGIVSSGSAGVSVVLPDGALVSPVCRSGYLLAESPYLVAAGGDAFVSWRFQLKGETEPGDTGEVPVLAPDLTLVDQEAATLAHYTAGTDPGVVTVRSTLTPTSSFDFEIYPPAEAVLVAERGDWNTRGDAFELRVQTEVGGRKSCQDPGPKQVTTLSPEVCLVGYLIGEQFETVEVQRYALVTPIAEGTCQLEIVADGISELLDYHTEVAPRPPEEQLWTGMCAADGETCGFRCPMQVNQDGCLWQFAATTCTPTTEGATCGTYTPISGTNCPATVEMAPAESACWPTP